MDAREVFSFACITRWRRPLPEAVMGGMKNAMRVCRVHHVVPLGNALASLRESKAMALRIT